MPAEFPPDSPVEVDDPDVEAAIAAADAARNADDDALRALVDARLQASIFTTPVVDAVEAATDALTDGSQRVGGTVAVSAVALPLPAGAATDANLTDLLSRVGPTASDTLLSLLRQVVTNTATEAAKVTHLDLTADTLNLSTDNLEGLLTTLNALVASETTLAALKAANHTDLVALATAFATLNAKDFATQTTAAAILAKLSADPATQTSLAALVTANHTDLLAVIAKNEQIRAILAGTLLVEPVPATATAWSDTGTVTATKYKGLTIANTSTTATAAVRVRNNNVSGTILDTIHLAPNESVSYAYPSGVTLASGTLYMQTVSGAVEGSVRTVA